MRLFYKNQSGFMVPRKLPKWIGKALCRVLPHRWHYDTDNTWWYCGRCRCEERREGREVWS